MYLAVYTFGMLKKPAHDPSNQSFFALEDPVFDLLERAPGFIARSGYPDVPGPAPWGQQTFPDYYVDQGDGWLPGTLSVWMSLETAFAFSYYGLHKDVYKRGREWFIPPKGPSYALFWHDADQYPRWHVATERHKMLHKHGPSPQAFTFKSAYDAKGAPTSLDMSEVERIKHSAKALLKQ